MSTKSLIYDDPIEYSDIVITICIRLLEKINVESVGTLGMMSNRNVGKVVVGHRSNSFRVLIPLQFPNKGDAERFI